MTNTVIYDKAGGYSGFLGNVMFQTASTIGIAHSNNMDYCFPPKDYFKFFKGPIPTRSVEELAKIETINWKEPHFHYCPVYYVATNDKVINLKGYYQSHKYWEHLDEEIKSIFTFNDEIVQYVIDKYHKEIIPPAQLISIHVRRGDYLKWPNIHPVLGMEYYSKASLQVYIRLGNPKPRIRFVVFSDDIEWCKLNFTEEDYGNVLFIEGNTAEQDMCLMSLCHHNIIANSSMSWWAQYLNANPNKIVVAPAKNKWFGSERAHHSVDDLYMDNWILV